MFVVKGGILHLSPRLSIAWNFHPSRNHRTIAFPLAISLEDGMAYIFVGPFTILWLRREFYKAELERIVGEEK